MQKYDAEIEEFMEKLMPEFRRFVSALIKDQSYKRFHHTGLGPVKELEHKFAQFYGAKYALSFSSATNALTAIAFSERIKPGDAVIIAPNMWGSAISGLKRRKDIDIIVAEEDQCGNIDVSRVEDLLNSSVKAVWVQDNIGIPHVMKELRDLCDKHSLLYISDASRSVGELTPEGPASSLADVWVISFGVDKLFPAGEGGMVLTDQKYWYEELLRYQHPERQILELGIGKESEVYFLNGRMHPISAIILNTMIEKTLIK